MTSQTPPRIVRQYVHTAIFSGVKVLSALLLLYILGQNLSPEQYGVYSLIASTITLGVYILGLDLYTYLSRWVPGSSDNERRLAFKTIFVFELTAAGLIILVMISLGLDRYLVSLLNIGDSWLLYRAGLLLLLLSLGMREMIRYLFAWKRIEIANKLEFLGTSSYIYALAILWFVGVGINLPTVLWVWSLALLMAVLYGLAKVEVGYLACSSMDVRVLKTSLLFSAPLFIATLSTQINNYADRFLLSALHSSSETGIYSLVYNMVAIGVLAWGTLFGNVMTPYATEYHNRQMVPQRDLIINMILKYSYLATIPLAVFILGSRGELLQILARPEFAVSERIIPVLLVVPMLIIVTIPLGLIIFLQAKTKLLAFIGITGAVLNTGLNIMFIPKYGALGAAWTSVLAFATVLGLSYLAIRDAGIISAQLSKVRELFLINVVLYLCMYYSRYLLIPVNSVLKLNSVGRIVFLSGFLALAYTVMLLSIRVVSMDEVHRLRKLLLSRPS